MYDYQVTKHRLINSNGHAPRTGEELTAELQAQAQDGWELISVVPLMAGSGGGPVPNFQLGVGEVLAFWRRPHHGEPRVRRG